MAAGMGNMSAVLAAMQGGGAGAAPTASPFRAAAGIPEPGMQLGGAPPGGTDFLSLLRSGTVGAEEVLQLIALLAGLGGAPPMQGPAGPEVQQVFRGG
jgi:hypothetical protein